MQSSSLYQPKTKKKTSKQAKKSGSSSTNQSQKVKQYQQKVRQPSINDSNTTRYGLEPKINETDSSQVIKEQDANPEIQIDIDLTTTKELRQSTESTLCSKESSDNEQQIEKQKQPKVMEKVSNFDQKTISQWKFGAFSQKTSSFMEYQPNSDDKEYQNWSIDKMQRSDKNNASSQPDQNLTPRKSSQVKNEFQGSPQDHQKIGFGKTIISPKTPEQLQSNNCLKNGQNYKSKSIHASGSKAVTNFKNSADRDQLGQLETQMEIQDYDLPLQIGQDVMNNQNYEVNSRFDLEGSQTSKVNLSKQFEQEMDNFANNSEKEEDDALEKQTSSSIFSSAVYCLKQKSPIKEFNLQQDQEEVDDRIQAQNLNFLDNMLDSGSDEEKEEEAAKDSLQPVKTQSVPTIFNAMSLFAFTSDGQSDNINNLFNTAFSASQNQTSQIQVQDNSNGHVNQSQSSSQNNLKEKFMPLQNIPIASNFTESSSHSRKESGNSSSCMGTPLCLNAQNDIPTMFSYLQIEDQQILCSLDFYCFDQQGCRMLQDKIMPQSENQSENSVNSSPFLKCLINNMLPILGNVMSNQFGNYLCQKIIEMSDAEALGTIVNSLQSQIIDISLSIHGTRVVQTLIDKLAKNIIEDGQSSQNHYTLMSLIQALNHEVVQLTMNMHGNHVIQAFLMQFQSESFEKKASEQYTQFIFKACMDYCIQIGMHKHGCCVMQRCLEKGTRPQQLELANHIILHMDYLIEDPYGNYLVQNVLKLEDEDKNEQIFMQIAKDFIRLSQLKFSSNVIEKCLNSKVKNIGPIKEQHIDKVFKGTFPQDDKQIIQELGYNSKKSQNLKARVHFIVQSLIYNQFGNYVLQKALVVIGDESLRKEILMVIKSLSPSLMQVKHGQKVLAKLQKTYPKIFGNQYYQNYDNVSQSSGFSSNHTGSNFSQGSYQSMQTQPKYQQKQFKQFVPGQRQKQYPFQPNTNMYNQNTQFNVNSVAFKPSFQENQSLGCKENQPFVMQF